MLPKLGCRYLLFIGVHLWDQQPLDYRPNAYDSWYVEQDLNFY